MPRDLSEIIDPIVDSAVPGTSDFIAEGTVATESDGVTFEWDVTAGRTYVFLVHGGEDAVLFDPVIEILDGDGNRIAFDDNTGAGFNPAINLTADETDTYFINVRGVTEDFGGSFVLTVHTNDGFWGTEEDIGDYIASEANGDPWAWSLSTRNPSLDVDLNGLTENGRRLAERALEAWSEITGIAFESVNSGADITFDDTTDNVSLSFSGTTTTGYGNGFRISSATVEVSDSSTSAVNSEAFWDFMAGIGEALGLGSPDAGDFLNNSTLFSIMSGFNPADSDFVGGSNANPSNLSQADIHAIQRLYELSPDINRGTTVYGLDSNVTGYMGDFFGEVFNGNNGNHYDGGAFGFTIMDTGGNDTFDASNFSEDQVMDLRNGGVSDIGGFSRNVVVAEQSGTIENGLTGSGNDFLYGNEGDNILTGNGGRDVIIGFDGADEIKGGGGNDTVRGSKGQDRVFGGAGNDRVLGGDGLDRVWGNNGNDILRAGDGNDILIGGSGKDEIDGGEGKDTLRGDGGNDQLFGREGDDKLTGGGGNDILNGGTGNDEMSGGNGNDQYYVEQRGDTVSEGSNGGIDTVFTTLRTYTLQNNFEILEIFANNLSVTYTGRGNGADNTIEGPNRASAIIFGGEGNDTILGGRKSDTLYGDNGPGEGGSGNDTIRAGGGNDRVEGDGGNDRLYGDAGADTILGGDGNDDIWGGGGNDTLNGDLGDDNVRGNAGNDRIQGRDGNDILTGGSGRDVFVFDAVKNADVIDRITDFNRQDDSIELQRSLTNVSVAQSGGDTIVTYFQASNSQARTIILEDVSLTAAQIDFVFV